MRKEDRRLLLIGGGHAHLDILRRLALQPQPGLRVTLVSWFPRHHYSGMVPGYLSGTYSEEEISFDLAALCARSGSRFICGRAESVSVRNRVVHLAGEKVLDFDLLSFNVGSGTLGGDQPDVLEHAQQVKPMSRVVRLREKLSELIERVPREVPFINVVGGGAAGFEVCCAITALLRQHGVRVVSALIDSRSGVLMEYPRRFRKLAARVLRRHEIQLETGCPVEEVQQEAILFGNQKSRRSDLTVWLTGPAAPELFRNSGLELSDDGFLLVDDSLRSVSEPNVFAVGDCATMAQYPESPKAGVYAVKHAPVLWKTLMWAVSGAPLPHYVPQERFLSILNTADGKALLFYKGLSLHSGWAWHLKDWIDRGFVNRYQSLVS